jgi:SAM-dependent methyltransferase
MGGALPLPMPEYGVRRRAARRRHRQPGEGRPNRRHSATTCQCQRGRAALHAYDAGVTYYERIGVRYSASRRPDPRIEDVIAGALGDAASVVNVGAGTGSYEPTDRRVVAVEPTRVMLGQRASGTASAVQAVAEALPFSNDAFEASMAILTLHHWSHPVRGLAELRRVASNRAIVLTITPDYLQSFWLTTRYFPAIGAWDAAHFPPIEVICSELGGTAIVTRVRSHQIAKTGFWVPSGGDRILTLTPMSKRVFPPSSLSARKSGGGGNACSPKIWRTASGTGVSDVSLSWTSLTWVTGS